MADLYWLAQPEDWRNRLRGIETAADPYGAAVALAGHRIDFLRTNALDQVVQRAGIGAGRPGDGTRPVRLAILGSSTTAHLVAGIRVGALRRGIPIAVHEGEYGQYWQELTDPRSGLHAFRPTAVLLALDGFHLAAGCSVLTEHDAAAALLAETAARVRECWRIARETLGCHVMHQMPLPVHPTLIGGNEQRLPGSRNTFLARLRDALAAAAAQDGVDVLAIDAQAARDGLDVWHDPALWHRSKQEVSPARAPLYGDLVARLIAARQGRSAKCLVLDLDNTVWGGVVGDDGLEGLTLGQGSALGEGFVAFQDYARELSRRGVILAVCSKNDEANAREPFERHPEMVLRSGDIACFMANWSDKAANLRAIAQDLNIGLDSLVFVDDNPFERTLVRQELPMVAVPEISEDPSSFARTLADAGYFEAVAITQEDRERSGQYQANRGREALKASSTDLVGYLRGLDMRLKWSRFDAIGLARTVQLINKTNQFNLTTRRYGEADVLAVMQDPRAFGLQLRLTDRFGDNGIIGIVVGRMHYAAECRLDLWLMSCRVLGRQVEQATLNLVAAQARALGARWLVGEYVPTKKNGMVRHHYANLGFAVTEEDETGGSRARLDLAAFRPADTFILTEET